MGDRDEIAPASDDTVRLFERMTSEPAVRDEIVERHRALATYLARRFSGRGESLEDLIQVASIGLIKAVDRFDPGREVQFSTYATATIVGELKRHFRDRAWAIRVPRRLQEAGMAVNRSIGELYQDLGRAPRVGEIAARTGLSEEEVLEATEALQAYSTTSLDAPSDDERTRVERLGSDDDSMDVLESWTSVVPHVRQLPSRERRILYLRFFRGLTQSEIARDLGISQMHVSRVLAATLRELREAAGGRVPEGGPDLTPP